MKLRARSLLALLCLAACVRAPLPARQPVRSIAVLPANNRTGDPLLIAGASFLETYVLPTERYSVADALVAAARAELAQRGFEVVAPQVVDAATDGQAPSNAQEAATLAARNHIDGAVLYIEIRRWESSGGSAPAFIIASVTATLIEPASGQVLWTGEHPSRPVQTPGIINLGDAYAVAARGVMTTLLAPLVPAPRSLQP